MTLPVVFTANGQTGYNLTKSLRFRSSATAYMNRTPASASNQTTWTFSAWVKRGELSSSGTYTLLSATSASPETRTIITFEADGSLDFFYYNGTSYPFITQTSAVYRDPAAWYHIVVAYDSTQATSSNRIKMYVNGSQITAFQTATYPSQNTTSDINSTKVHNIGRRGAAGNDRYFDGYMTEINFIDGQALTPSSFGSTNALTGVWQPAKYTGTYGTNGFYLPFTNTTSTTTLGYDFSGNSNNWTTNNFSLTAGTTYDSMNDVPTLTSTTVANYAVLNPLQTNNSGALTYANGNLNAAHGSGTSSSGGVYKALSSMASSSGKFYAEFVLNSFYSNGASGADMAVGVTSDLAAGNLLASPVGYAYYADGGGKYNNGSGSAYGSSWTTGDVIGIALDVTNGKVWFAKNNTWQASGDPAAGTNAAFTGLTGSFAFAFANSTASSAFVQNFTVNFGQQPFTYTPPTGFVGMNTYNLPNSTIVQGNKYMDATTYTGTGSAATITNTAGFKSDLVWLKCRSNATNHYWTDSIRGTTKQIYSNTTAAEGTSGNILTAFNSNGFSLGTDAEINGSTRTYVGWQWQAGQGTTSSNTSGTVTSTVSVNTTAGFSVVTFNAGSAGNQSFGHGLGVAPKFIIMKDRTTAGYGNWSVFFSGITASNQYLYLNATDAIATLSGVWGSGVPTSTVVNFGSNVNVGANNNCVAYCWAEIAGFSKFGSYTGNGSTDGTFIYTGFRPKYIMIKRTDSTGNWVLQDTSRSPYNQSQANLYANLSNPEDTGTTYLDILSNGFKCRVNENNSNINGGTYIYAAFAENPFKNALAR